MFIMNLYIFVRLYIPPLYIATKRLINCTNTAWSFLQASGTRTSWVWLLTIFFMIKIRVVFLKAQTRWYQYWYHTVTTLPNNRFRLTHYINNKMIHIIITPNTQLSNVSTILDHNQEQIFYKIKPFVSYTQDKLYPEDLQLHTPLSVVYIDPNLEQVDLLSEVAF